MTQTNTPIELPNQPLRISRIDVIKWTLFVLFTGRLFKLEIESRPALSDAVIARWAKESSFMVNGNITNFTRIDGHATNSYQRIVILPGPHKAASTSVQSYLVKLAKDGILNQHNWTWVGKENAKGFSLLARDLLYTYNKTDNLKLEKFQKDTYKQWKDGNSLVVAAEFMDYVAALPELEARLSINNMWSWLPSENRVEAAIMYRSPRVSHLISIWKQQCQFQKAKSSLPWRTSLDKKLRRHKMFGPSPTLAEWLCYGEYPKALRYDIETILTAQLNPFGMAYAYHKYGNANVTLIDMNGTPDGDVPSSVVCDILGLPCSNGKMAGGTEVESAVLNHKSSRTQLGMTDAHLSEAEEVIRDMDCYYYCLLGENIHVLHGKDLIFQDGRMSWERCCQRSEEKDVKTNKKWMANQLIEIGCRAIEET